ncbi:stage II sporulation protein M [Chloroflexota bacterium]
MKYRWWIVVAALIFVAGISTGFVVPLSLMLTDDAVSYLQDLARSVTPFTVTMAMVIYLQNCMSVIVSFILSPLLCFMPSMSLFLNGLLIGGVSITIVEEKSLGFLLAGLLPHGVIEIPALIVAQAAALSFGAMALILVIKRESRLVLLSTVRRSTGHIVLTIVLFFIIGIFHTIMVTALMDKRTKDPLLTNLRQNMKYLVLALALLLPAAFIEAFVTPWLLS